MEFKTIKVTLQNYPDRLYRTLAVREDIRLDELGAAIGLSINSWFADYYYFKDSKNTFEFDSFKLNKDSKSILTSHLKDIKNKFIYVYDQDDSYVFDCQLLKDIYNLPDDEYEEAPVAFVVDGKGQGIFENDKDSLEEYLNGNVAPTDGDDEDRDILLPDNMYFEQFGDFEKPLDVEKMCWLKDEIASIVDSYNDFINFSGDDLDEYDEDDDFDEDDIEMTEVLFGGLIAMLTDKLQHNKKLKKLEKKITDFNSEENPVDVLSLVSFSAMLKLIHEENEEFFDLVEDLIDEAHKNRFS